MHGSVSEEKPAMRKQNHSYTTADSEIGTEPSPARQGKPWAAILSIVLGISTLAGGGFAYEQRIHMVMKLFSKNLPFAMWYGLLTWGALFLALCGLTAGIIHWANRSDHTRMNALGLLLSSGAVALCSFVGGWTAWVFYALFCLGTQLPQAIGDAMNESLQKGMHGGL